MTKKKATDNTAYSNWPRLKKKVMLWMICRTFVQCYKPAFRNAALLDTLSAPNFSWSLSHSKKLSDRSNSSSCRVQIGPWTSGSYSSSKCDSASLTSPLAFNSAFMTSTKSFLDSCIKLITCCFVSNRLWEDWSSSQGWLRSSWDSCWKRNMWAADVMGRAALLGPGSSSSGPGVLLWFREAGARPSVSSGCSAFIFCSLIALSRAALIWDSSVSEAFRGGDWLRDWFSWLSSIWKSKIRIHRTKNILQRRVVEMKIPNWQKKKNDKLSYEVPIIVLLHMAQLLFHFAILYVLPIKSIPALTSAFTAKITQGCEGWQNFFSCR